MTNPSEISRNRGSHFSAGHGNKETSGFARLAEAEDIGPTDAELQAIESGSESAGVFTPEEVNKYRIADAAINPQAAMVQRARKLGQGEVPEQRSTSFEPVMNAERTGSGMSDIQAQADLMGDVADVQQTEEIASGEGSAASSYNDEDSGRGRRFPVMSMGGFEEAPGKAGSPMSSIYDKGESARIGRLNTGLLMLREAGRCDAPGCQLLRAAGMQLTGQTQRAAGSGIASQQPAIPAVHKESSYYPENPATGKQDRRNPKTIIESKPADPNHPEWKALTAETKVSTAGNIKFFPEDMLEHNHGDEMEHLEYVQQRLGGMKFQ